jgi:hypothetical protein
MILALADQKRLLFFQIQTLPPILYHGWKEMIDFVLKTTNGKIWGNIPDKKFH